MFGRLKGNFDQQKGLAGNSLHYESEQLPTYEQVAEDPSSSSSTGISSRALQPSVFPEKDPLSAVETSHTNEAAFASIALCSNDRIRILQLPADACDIVRNVIVEAWPQGIQHTRDFDEALEFKLHGAPWSLNSDLEPASRLTCRILERLASAGWVLYTASDVSMSVGSHATLFLRYQQPAPARGEWFSCAFKGYNGIRVIDAPQEVLDDLLTELQQYIKNHEPHKVHGVHKIKLNGPYSFGDSNMNSRRVMLQMLSVFDRHGYKMHASFNQRDRSGNGAALDTWFLTRPANGTALGKNDLQ